MGDGWFVTVVGVLWDVCTHHEVWHFVEVESSLAPLVLVNFSKLRLLNLLGYNFLLIKSRIGREYSLAVPKVTWNGLEHCLIVRGRAYALVPPWAARFCDLLCCSRAVLVQSGLKAVGKNANSF